MHTICILEALQYREKHIQIKKKVHASVDAFGSSRKLQILVLLVLILKCHTDNSVLFNTYIFEISYFVTS